MDNDNLADAKQGKRDEFYTQWVDIEKEMNAYLEFNPLVFEGKTILLPCDDPEWSNFTLYFAQNFARFGLKKLVSTSYAPARGHAAVNDQLSLFGEDDPKYDAAKTTTNGRIYTLTRDTNEDGRININDLEWDYLEGDGDFSSDEVRALRDEADIIITNPPFSKFREFLAWIEPSEKQFLVIGNINAVANKNLFPLITSNQVWLGATISGGDREFRVPDAYPLEAAGWRVDDDGNKFIRVKGVRWFTNLEHGRRHEPLSLLTEADNIKFNKDRYFVAAGRRYRRYDNYDAIEVPCVSAIPKDYGGVMGVPISFLDKYCPEQFEIVGLDRYVSDNPRPGKRFTLDGSETYARILIRHRKDGGE